jgi:hydroxyacylglutathione hydrolase
MLYVAAFRFNTYLENTYIVFDRLGKAAVIDPGMYTPAERHIFDRYLYDMGLQLHNALLTHAHIDHILGLAYVQQRYNVPVTGHEGELRSLPLLKSYGAGLGYLLDDVKGEVVKVQEGGMVNVGEEVFTILLTPGHTQHSISFYLAEQQLIFSGDVVFMSSLGNTSLPGANAAQLRDTVKNRILTLPSATVFFPGHGPVSTIRYISDSYEKGYLKGF